MRSFLPIVLVALTAACSRPSQPAGPLAMSDLPNVSTEAILADTRKLSSDEFEGRAPGTKGEELTVQYLIEQFKAAGLQPGNPDGTWTQKVPLVSLTPQTAGPVVVKRGGQHPAVQDSRRNRRRSASTSPTRCGSRTPSWSSPATASRRPSSSGTTSGRGREGQDDRRPRQRSARRRDRQSERARSEDVRRQGDDLLRPLDLQVREGRRARRRRRAHRPRDRSGRRIRSPSCRAWAASGSTW